MEEINLNNKLQNSKANHATANSFVANGVFQEFVPFIIQNKVKGYILRDRIAGKRMDYTYATTAIDAGTTLSLSLFNQVQFNQMRFNGNSITNTGKNFNTKIAGYIYKHPPKGKKL